MANILHKIKAYLYNNVLTKDNPNDYIARTAGERSLSVRDICEAAVSRGSSDVPAATMAHAVELFHKEMAYQLCDGFSVNTGYYFAGTTIRGVFESATDTFDSSRHSILFQFSQGERLRAEIPNIGIEIMGVADAAAAILQVKDVKTGSVNDVLTPGRNLKITGSRIRITGTDPANGIYFVDAAQQRVAVDPSDYVSNNPSELIIVIPDLPAGTYTLEVVTQHSHGAVLKQPRTAVFEKPLTVL